MDERALLLFFPFCSKRLTHPSKSMKYTYLQFDKLQTLNWSILNITQIHKYAITQITNTQIHRICAFVLGKFVILWYSQPPYIARHKYTYHKYTNHWNNLYHMQKSSQDSS